MRRIIAILALAGSCTSWHSNITTRDPYHVEIDLNRSGACASSCAAQNATCLMACPGSHKEWGECADDREPGTCFRFFDTRTMEQEGRCSDLVAKLEASGHLATECSDKKSTTAIGTVGAVLSAVALVAVLLLVYAVPAS